MNNKIKGLTGFGLAVVVAIAGGFAWIHREGKKIYIESYPRGLEFGLADKGMNMETAFGHRPELGPNGIYKSHLENTQTDGETYEANGIQINW
jgi:hypothetical protein